MKKKICIDCGEYFIPAGRSARRCGNRDDKTGCSYQYLLEQVRQRSRRPKNKEKKRIYIESEKGKFGKYKCGAKERNIKFDLTFEEFISYWQKPCAYCGSKIDTIGLDRMDSGKGYLIDNVCSCCWECNKLKGSRNRKDFIEKCKKIVDNFQRKNFLSSRMGGKVKHKLWDIEKQIRTGLEYRKGIY